MFFRRWGCKMLWFMVVVCWGCVGLAGVFVGVVGERGVCWRGSVFRMVVVGRGMWVGCVGWVGWVVWYFFGGGCWCLGWVGVGCEGLWGVIGVVIGWDVVWRGMIWRGLGGEGYG